MKIKKAMEEFMEKARECEGCGGFFNKEKMKEIRREDWWTVPYPLSPYIDPHLSIEYYCQKCGAPEYDEKIIGFSETTYFKNHIEVDKRGKQLKK